MKLKAFDLICLAGSLGAAIIYKSLTGDAETADQVGLCLMLSWVAMQCFWFLRNSNNNGSNA